MASGAASSQRIRETDLYTPVKSWLQGQGFLVKAEVGSADIVAIRDGDDPVIIELKTGFSLALYHQAIARQKLADAVYVAVPQGPGRTFLKMLRNNITLCRLLGLGLLTVRLKDGAVTPHLDPAPYHPRKSKPRKGRLLKEFARRVGDPNIGGSARGPLMTAYRQDALRCVALLHVEGSLKAQHVAARTGVENARRLMADDHYGWFERVATGIYALTPKGHAAAGDYMTEIETLLATALVRAAAE